MWRTLEPRARRPEAEVSGKGGGRTRGCLLGTRAVLEMVIPGFGAGGLGGCAGPAWGLALGAVFSGLGEDDRVSGAGSAVRVEDPGVCCWMG